MRSTRSGEITIALGAAFARNPERFVRKPPAPRELPTAAWVNKPAETKQATASAIETSAPISARGRFRDGSHIHAP